MDNLPEPIRVVSDLHLGHPACRLQSVEPLRPLFENAKTIVFNGDTWEHGNPFLADEAKKRFDELLELLDELDVTSVFLNGNHDAEISDREYLDLLDGNVFIIHGDCLFETISPWSPQIWKREKEFAEARSNYSQDELRNDFEKILEYTSRCRHIAEREEHTFKGGRFRVLRSVVKLIFPPRRIWEVLKCWRETPPRVDRFRKKHRPKANFVLMGHIHHPGIWVRSEGYTLINTGGFMSIGKAQVVEINGGKIRVFKVDESDARAFRLLEISDPTGLGH